MYRNCVWCYSDLGENESIEHFPIGRRLAFDAAKGWLWVVCRKCDRWNLTPLEERWEAIEECERRFRASKLRVSTDQIGLVRIDNGLDLVRIGAPLRPEFAVWRYGDRFARRRRQALAIGGASVMGGALMSFASPVLQVVAGSHGPTEWISLGAGLVTAASFYKQIPRWATSYYRHWSRARVSLPGQPRAIVLKGERLASVSLSKSGDEWSLSVPYDLEGKGVTFHKRMLLRGDEALRAVARILPALNARGGKPETVQAAVAVIDETPDVGALFQKFASPPGQSFEDYLEERRTQLSGAYSIHHEFDGDRESARRAVAEQSVFHAGQASMAHGAPISTLPDPVRLALEMATHESAERRAMEGELALLTHSWKEAAEIAATADSMFLPAAVTETFARIKGLPGSNSDTN